MSIEDINIKSILLFYIFFLLFISCQGNEKESEFNLIENSKIAQVNKTNIIIFYIDDLGFQPECYGGNLAPTPNINQLAKNGVLFTNGYVSSPVCSPSRVALLTGKYQARTGHDANTMIDGQEMSSTYKTIPELIKPLGYVSGIIGKWHLGHFNETQLPTQRGFDFFIGNSGNINSKIHSYYKNNERIENIAGHPITSERWANEAVQFIENNKDKPYFLYLPFHAVHNPMKAKKTSLDKYKDKEDFNLRKLSAVLDELDQAIGRVMEKVRKEKQEENTLIFFISDNGPNKFVKANMNGGLRGHKWQLWEGGIRIPYIVQWKGKIKPNQIMHSPVIQTDVLPTILDAVGYDTINKNNFDGWNLLPMLENRIDSLEREHLFWRFGNQYAIRKGDWKLVKVYQNEKKPSLINLKNDKGEKNNLYDKYPDIARELQRDWDTWNESMLPPRWVDERWNFNSE